MGLFLNSAFARPVPSFPAPVTPPDVDPNVGPFATIQVNCEWLPYIRGALMQLGLQATWKGTLAEVNLAQDRANLLITLFNGTNPCDCGTPCPSIQTGIEGFVSTGQITVDCDCNVFIECCDGTKVQLLTSKQQNPGPAQPGAGSPQPKPGGGTAEYCFQLAAVGQALLPTTVSTGDVIQITNLLGAWHDTLALFWNCPDGFLFLDGLCFQTFNQQPTDPIPTLAHMEIIANIGGTFYDVLQVDAGGTTHPFTVPAGHVNDQVTFQANNAPLSNGFGEVGFCAQVTNNQTPTWTKIFDFTNASDFARWFARANSAGFTPATLGNHVTGTGYEGVYSNNGAQSYDVIALELDFIGTITSVLFEYSVSGFSFDGDVADSSFALENIGHAALQNIIMPATPANPQQWTGTVAVTSGIWFQIIPGANLVGPADPGETVTVTRITISGTGVNPFA